MRRPSLILFLLLLGLSLTACVTPGVRGDDDVLGDDDDATAPFTPSEWQAGPPVMQGAVRGREAIRIIAHLHSHWSHDACDGNPQPDGVPDEACYQDLRDGLCTDRIDVAFLSDHPGHATETGYETLLLFRDGDEVVRTDLGAVVGTRFACDNGHQVTLLPGIESSDMMPLAIDAHIDEGYSGVTEEEWDRVSDVGGLRWIAHTETRDLDVLAAVGLEGLELYQLHANLAPNLREEFLGLDPFGYLGELGPFIFPETNGILDPPHPDLAPLGFLLLNEPSIVALETLGQTQHLGITGGTDAHQNVFPADASDFERIDSYRRMMRWFNNWLLLPPGAEITPDVAQEALRAGRAFVVFEVFGTPEGFDVELLDGDASAGSLGDEATFSEGMSLRVTPPTLDMRSPRGTDSPEVITRVYYADPDGRTLLAEAEGEAPITVVVPGPGVLRVEVWLRPRHLRPYLGEVADDYTDTPVPWIQTGGVFLR